MKFVDFFNFATLIKNQFFFTSLKSGPLEAHLLRALVRGTEGRGFKSPQPPH